MKKLSLTSLMSGGIITNYFCSSQCSHCLYRCSPQWPNDYMDEETAVLNFQVCKKMHCYSVHIGGGEPLLFPPGLFKVLEAARKEEISIDYVETNSSWYKNHDQACNILNSLLARDVHTLLVSMSPFHNEFIPFSKVKGVLAACRETGMNIFPWVSDFYSDIDLLENNSRHTPEEYTAKFGPQFMKNVLKRYWISPGGRAIDLLNKLSDEKHTVHELSLMTPCLELANTGHFHIDLYGNYIPGLCAGLAIQRDDLGEPLNEEEYPFVTCLFNEGIGGLLEFAQKKYNILPAKKLYTSKCELCAEIRFTIVNNHGMILKELQPAMHYIL